MLIKDVLKRCCRSRHPGIITDCLKQQDGLLLYELYNKYYKRCKDEGIKPIPRANLHAMLEYYEEKGIIRREKAPPHDITIRIWLVE